MRQFMATLIGAAIVAGAVSAQGQDPKVAIGQKLFASTKCNMCHGPNGKGNSGKLSLVGVGAKLPVADMRKWITSPAEMEAKLAKQPAVKMSSIIKPKAISDPDVDALIAYVQSLK